MAREDDMFGPYIGQRKLNIGCAGNSMPGWDNLDKDPRTKPNIVWTLGGYNDPNDGYHHIWPAMDNGQGGIPMHLPCPPNTYDTVMASHVLEHIPQSNLFDVFNQLHQIIKPEGFLIAITPYGMSDDAWENPHHRQMFTENTYAYFTKRLYAAQGAGYKAYEGELYSDWTIADIRHIPYPEFENDPELRWKKKHLRNIVRELQVVMQVHK